MQDNERQLTVVQQPGSITTNLADLDRYVEDQLAIYDGWKPSADNADDVKAAKAHRTSLNNLKKSIESERIMVKAQYLAPLKEFEGNVKTITGKIDAAVECMTNVINDAEAKRKADKYAKLCEHYEEFAGALVGVVSYEQIHDEKWLNKAPALPKAFELLEEKARRVAYDWQTLNETDGLFDKDAAERVFFQTLDLSAAIRSDKEAREQAERIAELHSVVEPVREERPEPVEEAVPQTIMGVEFEPVMVYSFVIEATEYQYGKLIELMKGMGVHGIPRKHPDAVSFREMEVVRRG